MAERRRLRPPGAPRRLGRWLALLTALVLLGHGVFLEWMARHASWSPGLQAMPEPMFTRLLEPADPPPVAALPAPPPPPPPPAAVMAAAPQPVASRPADAASTPASSPDPEPPPATVEPSPPTAVASASSDTPPAAVEPGEPGGPARQAATPASGPSLLASGPGEATAASASASAPAAAGTTPSANAVADAWPADSRVTYKLSGLFRGGPLYGSARVHWLRQGTQYQARVELSLVPFGAALFTSQGRVTASGLVPEAFEEARGSRRRVTRFTEREVVLHDGRSLPRPEGVQDMASQFIELGWRFRTGQSPTALGSTMTLPLVRPGGVDAWTYDIYAHEFLRTERLGELEVVRVTPRPYKGARGTLAAEIWFAPRLQYLPARFKVTFGEEASLDLVIESVEQR